MTEKSIELEEVDTDSEVILVDIGNLKEKPKISLHARTRLVNLKTMRTKAMIGAYWVVVLIDTSSTNNFLDPGVLQKTLLMVDGDIKVQVKVANEDSMGSEG